MAENLRITCIKSANGDQVNFYDKGAIRGIKLNKTKNEYLLPDEDGNLILDVQEYESATDKRMGLVAIPTMGPEIDIKNDLILKNGQLYVNFPIKQITDGTGKPFEIPDSINKTLVIRTAKENSLGLVQINTGSNYCVKADNGYLYVRFSEGYTDIGKETKNIDFKELISAGRLSEGVYN